METNKLKMYSDTPSGIMCRDCYEKKGESVFLIAKTVTDKWKDQDNKKHTKTRSFLFCTKCNREY